jgi:transcriptional regulator with XRE-family HTH domain
MPASLPAPNVTTDEPGLRLKRIRERLNLRYRDVEDASIRIAERRKNDEFIILLSRLSDIENRGTVPSIYRLYSLCTIYRLDLTEVLDWYGVDLSQQPGDAASISIERTHAIGFGPGATGEVLLPLALDPGLDPRRTSYLSRLIQKWGKLPLTLLNSFDIKDHRYAFIGSEDWSMYPLIPPGSLVLIDENQRRIVNSGWSNEFERPIYFLEHRDGFSCGWCTVGEGQLVLQPHPASMCAPEMYKFPGDIEVIGQVTGIAMHLDPGRRRRVRGA